MLVCARLSFSSVGNGLGRRVLHQGLYIRWYAGAVYGAIMVLGLKYSQIGDDEAENKAIAYKKTNEFMERFKSENGSYICKDILGCDISTDEGRTYAQENNSFKEICPRMVKSAVNILESIV